MKKLIPTLCLLLALGGIPRSASACGGPAYYPFGITLSPIDAMADGFITPSDELGDGFTVDAFLFLYPFHVDPAHQAQTEDLWNLSYSNNRSYQGDESQPSLSKTNLEGFEAALHAGNLDQAEAEARRTVDAILDMPVAQANDNQQDFARALEFLEVRPFLKGTPTERLERFFILPEGSAGTWPPDPKGIWETLSLPVALQQALIVRRADRKHYGDLAKQFPQSPRAGTLGFVALQEKFAQEIPNGWGEDIRKAVKPETWQGLQAAADQWLKQFPKHPLADLAKLAQLRAYYFQEDKDHAWNLLLDLYPRRLPRVLGEMRFLVKQSLLPSDLKNPKIDPLLRSAFLGVVTPGSGEWTQDWNLATQNLPAPWAINMQERLLRQAIADKASGKTLPSGFPATPANPTPLWGQLRLLALMKAERLDDALAQAKTMPSSDPNDLIKARLYLARHELITALSLPKLAEESKDYLVRVLSDATTLQKICKEGDKAWRHEACLTLATREAGQGHWDQGATWLQDNDGARAALFRDAAKLSADSSPAGTLAWARFLRSKQGKVFFPSDTLWYRSLNYRLDNIKSSAAESAPSASSALPWSPTEESRAIQDYLTDGTELFYALKAYAAWLKQAKPKDPEAAKVLQEADKTYNALVNRDNYNSQFWQEFLDKSEWAQTIRSAGKAIRGT